MKDIKSFLIGFLMCTCMFLFMGQTDAEREKQNKFEIHMSNEAMARGFILNTQTGETWYLSMKNKVKH